MIERIGERTIALTKMPRVVGFGSVVGKKEGEGPLAKWFDKIYTDTTMGGETWEKAEAALQKMAVTLALESANVESGDVDSVFAGDLLNQCISSCYGLRDLGIPFLGQYGACSTMAQTLALSAVIVESGAANISAAVTSSHFCSAERQFRYPLQYGGQRTPTAQWTVTGAGSVILASYDNGSFAACDEKISKNGDKNQKRQIAVEHVCPGKIIDMGITDANNMGAAMAGAAADTIYRYLCDTNTSPEDYNLILTGDLGKVGTDLLYELLDKEGVDIRQRHNDCGLLIFDTEAQDVHAGGSGCGCSASVLCSYIMKRMRKRELNSVLFAATGALMSPTIIQQGESIPGISHIVHLRNCED